MAELNRARAAGILEADDIDVLFAVFGGSRFAQVTAGQFHAHREYTAFNGFLCFSTQWNQRLLCEGLVPEGHYLLLTASRRDSRMKVHGRTLDEHNVSLHAPGADFECLTDETSHHVVAFVPAELIENSMPNDDRVHTASGVMLTMPVSIRRQFIAHIKHAVSDSVATPERLTDDRNSAILAHNVLNAVLTCLDSAQRLPDHHDASSRRVVFRRAIRIAESHRWMIGSPELAAAAHVAQRTLQCAFQEILGISPTRFLRIQRMHAARRALHTTSLAQMKISDIALTWGFGDPGRFAVEYRRLFGESPSATLASSRCLTAPDALRVDPGDCHSV
jgi:AraC family ethanolamine operon transcriptional activator